MFGLDLAAFIHEIAGLETIGVHTRRLPLKAELPAVVYRITESSQRMFQDGPAGPLNIKAQIAVGAKTPAEAETTVRALVDAINGYRGAFGESLCEAARARRLVDDAEPEAGMYWAGASIDLWLDDDGGS